MVTVWSTWADKKGFSPDIVSYDAEELALKLGKFFWKKERKKDGSNYDLERLRVMLASHGAVSWRSL